MWLSGRMGQTGEKKTAQTGTVTLSGERTGICTDAEQRGIRVAAPGGYAWRPQIGQEALVIKCGDHELCAAGVVWDADGLPEAGEVRISSAGGASIWLNNDGQLVCTGDVVIKGQLKVSGGIESNGNAIG